jgi:multidrug efflux pump subunit AcrB
MWLVNAALRHPYGVWVGMLLVTALGFLSYRRTPTDILPTLKVPVVVVFASYRGMPAPDMEQSVTSILERALTKCDHLDHIESRSILGISIIRVYFRPSVSGDIASSQVIALVNGEMQNMPPGMLPPTILNYDASAIPVGNLVITSQSRDDKFLLDFADNQLREELAGIEGLASAPVFGGVFRQVQIYVHPRSLESLNMSPLDVARIVNTQSSVIPTGEIRVGRQNYYVRSNALIQDPRDFEQIPLYNDGRKIVRLGDVANVLDGTRWRTNTVRVDGRRSVYLPLLRQAGASAIRVVDNVQSSLTELRDRGAIPEDVEVEVAFDQSIYVRDALANLRSEAVLGAILASLVVLLFLGSMRSTWIVAVTIPLSLLAAFGGLYFAGETLNIMTLGGLALVLGRVVDDAVVDVENTVRHLHMGKTSFQAALDSAHEISIPVLMATVTTVIVFLPLVFMVGLGKYLFTPLAVSVALAMFASYIVSRTVSPLLCSRLLRPGVRSQESGVRGQGSGSGSSLTPDSCLLTPGSERYPRWLLVLATLLIVLGGLSWGALNHYELPLDHWSVKMRQLIVTGAELLIVGALAGVVLWAAALLFWVAPLFDRFFRVFTRMYERMLAVALRRRYLVLGAVAAMLIPAYFAFRGTGQELFPDVDSSEFTLHMRATGGPRVEETERQIEQIEKLIRGYQATPEMLASEVKLARKLEEEDFLAAIRAVNPDDAALIDRLAAASQPETSRLVDSASGRTFTVPGVIPPEDMVLMLANIGVNARWSAIYTTNNGPHAAFLRVQLRSGFAGRRTPTIAYVNRIRARLKKRYPAHDFFFETEGMIRRILNSGAVAPIEVQVLGRDHEQRRYITQLLHKQITQLASVHDAHSPQSIDLPQVRIVVDRVKAAQPGLTEADVIRNVITALMSSAQIAPNFWIDPKTGNPYLIGVQYPEHAVTSIRTLEEIPLTGGRVGPSVFRRGQDAASPRGSKGPPTVRLEDVATIERGMGPVEIFHYAANRVSQLFVSVSDKDLAGVASDIELIVRHFPVTYALDRLPGNRKELGADEIFTRRLENYLKKPAARERAAFRKDYDLDPDELRLPRGVRIQVRGEVQAMRHSFGEMAFSLALAVLLVYLIMAAQFASWLDPLIMIVSAPLGLIGVALTLWLTSTSLNVQSCMGVLMMAGISVSNSVLVVEFGNRQREQGMSIRDAILSAASVRLRPILMTTIATLVGLAPMAIHLHPGDEMNLPLARAVIGGLAGSTLLTLFVVPVLYVTLKPRSQGSGVRSQPEALLAHPATFAAHMPHADWGDAAFGPHQQIASPAEPPPPPTPPESPPRPRGE